MTHPISYKTLISTRSKKDAPRTKSNIRQPTIQIPSLGSTLIANKVCLMPLSPPQTMGLGSNRVAVLNSNFFSHLVTKGLLHTDVASSAAQPKLGGQDKLPRGDVCQPIAGGSMNEAACPPKPVLSKQPDTESPHSSTRRASGRDATAGSLSVQSNPVHHVQGIALQVMQRVELPVDHRLLTVKLGGWGHGSSNGGGFPHKEEVKAPKQKVSLHVAPRPLPGYLVKLVNQLMRHGKKGVSIGLLADSLVLFCKRLEDGRRSKLHTASTRSTILPHNHERKDSRPKALRNGQEPWISRPHGPHRGRGPALRGAEGPPKSIGSQGVPAFPFSLASFPGPSSGEMLPPGKGQLGGLLALPFSGAIPLHFPSTRASFVKRGGEHRGLLGFEASQALQEQEPCPKSDPFEALQSDARPGASLNELQRLNAKRSLGGDSGPTRAEMGLSFHTKKPLYFWPRKGSAILVSHSKGIKAQGPLPQASTLSCINRAISNVEPSLEVRKKKIAGITRQIPCVVSKARGERLAIRWIINSARDRVKKRGKGLAYCLAEELIDAYYKRGEPRQRRDSLHKAAESNRSFLRYRWW